MSLEFYGSFKKFLWLNQLFCSAPLKIDFGLERPKNTDKLTSVAHLACGLLSCSLVCFATYLQNKSFDTSMEFLTKVLYVGEYIIGTFNLLLIVVGCQYQRKRYKIFFDRLVDVDVNLQKCGIRPNYDSTRIFLKRLMITYTIFFTCVILVDFMYNSMHADSFIRSSTVYTIPNVVSSLALTQYAMVLHYINEKLKAINSFLSRLKVEIDEDRCQLTKEKLFVISGLTVQCDYSGLDKIIHKLRFLHFELSSLIELLNESFGLLIILILVAAYIILSIQFYAVYKMTEGFEATDIWLTIYTVLWMALHGAKVFLVLYPANNVSDERKKTGHLLYRMICSNRIPKISSAIQMFAGQLLHLSPLNAMRIINLDLTIVGTMFGVLTTYLIILIQFDASSREPKHLPNMTIPSS